MRSLRWDMDGLAVDTWRRVHFGDMRDIRLREDTVTELNLLELDIRHRPRLRVHRFNQHAERRNGSDWEWYIGTGRRWFALRIQAKRMDGMEYRKLQHAGYSDDVIHDDYQYDTLIRTSAAQTERPTFPYYVFFNGWATWPTDVTWYGCPNRVDIGMCSHAADLEFGCSAMPAGLVKSIHRGRGAPGRRVQEYLPYSVPWSWLFGPPSRSLLATARVERPKAARAHPGQPTNGPASYRPGYPPNQPGASTGQRRFTDVWGTWDDQFNAPVSTSGWGAFDDVDAVMDVDYMLAWHQAIAAVVPSAEDLEAHARDRGKGSDDEGSEGTGEGPGDGNEDGTGGDPRESYWGAVLREFGRRLERIGPLDQRANQGSEQDQDAIGPGPLPEYASAMLQLADLDAAQAQRALRNFDSEFGDDQRTVVVTDLGARRG